MAICERLTTDEGQQRVSARVYPALVPLDHPLAAVNGAFNAVVVEAEAAGRLMFYGQGAGGAPTASAVMGDVVMAARNRVQGGRGPRESKYAKLPISPIGFIPTRYVNMNVADRPGVLSSVAAEFAKREVSCRGPPGRNGRRGRSTMQRAVASSRTRPPTPRCRRPSRRWPTWMVERYQRASHGRNQRMSDELLARRAEHGPLRPPNGWPGLIAAYVIGFRS